MSGIQPQSLSDEEFERLVYMSLGQAGALPQEIVKELAARTTTPVAHEAGPNNPNQLPLPF